MPDCLGGIWRAEGTNPRPGCDHGAMVNRLSDVRSNRWSGYAILLKYLGRVPRELQFIRCMVNTPPFSFLDREKALFGLRAYAT